MRDEIYDPVPWENLTLQIKADFCELLDRLVMNPEIRVSVFSRTWT